MGQRCIGPNFLLSTKFESGGETTGSLGFNSRLCFNSKRLANTPQLTGVCPAHCPANHLFIEQTHAFTDAFRPNIIERCVDVPNSFLDGTIITYAIQLLVLLFEALIIVKSFCELISNAHNIPVIGDFFLPLLVQTDRAPTKLIDAHTGCHSGHVNQDIDARSIPTFAE